MVSGLEPEFQGVLNQNSHWLMKEIRVNKTNGALPDSFEILQKDARLVDMTIKQQNTVQERLNAGLEFKWLDEGIRRLAREFLKLLLQPIGKSIEFRETETGAGCGLVEYLENHNNALKIAESNLTHKKEQLIKDIGALLGYSA